MRQAARHAGDYSGHVSRPPRPVNLAALVRELDPLFRATAKSVPVEVTIDADQPAVVADETQLRQVLLNLVLNAADKGMNGALPIVLVTGYGGLAHARDGLFDGALAKPFSLVALCAVLRPLLPIRPE